MQLAGGGAIVRATPPFLSTSSAAGWGVDGPKSDFDPIRAMPYNDLLSRVRERRAKSIHGRRVVETKANFDIEVEVLDDPTTLGVVAACDRNQVLGSVDRSFHGILH